VAWMVFVGKEMQKDVARHFRVT
jgi:predicted transcriptional regulator